jgi:hypothetical protein
VNGPEDYPLVPDDPSQISEHERIVDSASGAIREGTLPWEGTPANPMALVAAGHEIARTTMYGAGLMEKVRPDADPEHVREQILWWGITVGCFLFRAGCEFAADETSDGDS